MSDDEYTYTDFAADELTINPAIPAGNPAAIVYTPGAGVRVEPADVAEVVAAMYRAAELPTPIVLERPDEQRVAAGGWLGATGVTVMGFGHEEMGPGHAREFAALVALAAEMWERRHGGPDGREDCLFCRRGDPENRILCESDRFYARYDNYPSTPGHIEVVPKKHIVSFFGLSAGEIKEAYALLRRARELIAAEHGEPDGWTIGINDGRAAGRSIDHLHIHLIPRHHGDVPDPRGGIRRALPNGDPDDWGARRETQATEGIARAINRNGATVDEQS